LLDVVRDSPVNVAAALVSRPCVKSINPNSFGPGGLFGLNKQSLCVLLVYREDAGA
jgi:hypothetical protein